MVSRRVFLKNGAFALVSLGFAPSFLARTAFAGAPAREAAHRDLSARRRRRPERGRAVRRSELLPRAAEHRDPAPRPGRAGALDLDGFFGFNPRLRPLKPLWDRRDARHRPCVRLARRDALALRRAGLHGDGDAGRQEHGGRLAEPLPAGAEPTPKRDGARRFAPWR